MEKQNWEEEPLYEDAKELVIREQKADAGFLQRKLHIGYAYSTRLIDMLEEEGIVSEADGAKPRKVLVPPKQV